MNNDAQTPQATHPLLEMRIRQLQMLLSETNQQFNSRIFNNTPENLSIEQVAEISVLAEALFVKVNEYSASKPQVPFVPAFRAQPLVEPNSSPIPEFRYSDEVFTAAQQTSSHRIHEAETSPEIKPEPTGM